MHFSNKEFHEYEFLIQNTSFHFLLSRFPFFIDVTNAFVKVSISRFAFWSISNQKVRGITKEDNPNTERTR